MSEQSATTRGLVAVSALVLLAAAGAALRGPFDLTPRLAPVDPDEVLPPTLPPLEEQPSQEALTPPPIELTGPIEIPGWVPWVLVLLVVAVAIAFLVVVLRRYLERRAGIRQERLPDDLTGTATAGGDELAPPDLTDALERATAALRAQAPPRDAVVAAWVSLEEAAATHGAARQPSQTPTEFTLALLHRTHADPAATQELRRLYLAARFGSEPVPASDVEDAGVALERISSTWATP